MAGILYVPPFHNYLHNSLSKYQNKEIYCSCRGDSWHVYTQVQGRRAGTLINMCFCTILCQVVTISIHICFTLHTLHICFWVFFLMYTFNTFVLLHFLQLKCALWITFISLVKSRNKTIKRPFHPDSAHTQEKNHLKHLGSADCSYLEGVGDKAPVSTGYY